MVKKIKKTVSLILLFLLIPGIVALILFLNYHFGAFKRSDPGPAFLPEAHTGYTVSINGISMQPHLLVLSGGAVFVVVIVVAALFIKWVYRRRGNKPDTTAVTDRQDT